MPAQLNSSRCIFCTIDPGRRVAENELAFAVRDTNPVTPLHTLILPKRHAPTFFDLSEAEARAVEELIRRLRNEIVDTDPAVQGFNIGINVGEAAGQTIFHCHYHLIPRRWGDVANPRGGVRWVIPSKGSY
jgi:diadenosine tetraphosphate (Ap4A) HIT family hydrolase